MKTASRIISIVSAVLCFLACVEYLLTGIILLLSHEVVRNTIETLEAEASNDIIYYILSYLYRMYTSAIITSFINAFLCVFYGIILLTTLNSNSKGMYIFKIILGIFISRIALIGSILGLIALERENSRKKEAEATIEK